MSTLQVYQANNEPEALALIEHLPAKVLAEAQKAAAALQDVISKKAHPVVMNDEQYLEFEDWQTLGRFYGITPKEDGDPEYVEFPGDVRGFKASAVALRGGEVISRATAYCLTDEEKWRSRAVYKWLYVCKDGSLSEEDPGFDAIVWEPNPKKPGKNRPKKERQKMADEPVPLFQLASMAQTRAGAKCLRQVLAWVAVLAGYRPTPAEEIQDFIETKATPVPATTAQHYREPGEDWPEEGPTAADLEAMGVEPNPAYDPPPRRESRTDGVPRVEPCPKCKTVRSVMTSKYAGPMYYCRACKAKFGPVQEQP